MKRRPPVTLWLHILWDLWRLILLTSAVLVTVIAFAAAVKPLADGKLGPVDTLRFMLLAMPPMLQYALPFAACFGATLAYHRLTADNEATAAYAGGISHRALIFPAVASGVVLAVLLMALSNRVIPEFLKRMSELVSQDISKIIIHQIKSGEAVPLGSDKRRFLFADDVVPQGPDPETGAFQKLWLAGLLLVKLDKQGGV
ncbi:MAG: LptF/LptG family permease, partial [Phycisphaerales bacterium]